MDDELTAAGVKARARELGFDACGIAPAGDHPELRFFAEWMARGYAASMAYLERSADRRADVRRVLPSARTVIVTATVYNTARPYSTERADPSRGEIARYAWGDDYHEVVGARLEALLGWMRDLAPEPFEALAYVDTGPVQERVPRAARRDRLDREKYLCDSSRAWLVDFSWRDHLQSAARIRWACVRSVRHLHALPRSVPDRRACIARRARFGSMHFVPDDRASRRHSRVVETGDGIARLRLRRLSGSVCPWNGVAPVSTDPAWQPRAAWDAPRLVDLLTLDDAELNGALRGSAMKRARAVGLRRNIRIASVNAVENPS